MKPKTLAINKETDGGFRMGFEEKRKYQRLSTHVHGEIFYAAEAVEVEVCDLSKSGARLKPVTSPDSLPQIGDTLDLALTWPIPTRCGNRAKLRRDQPRAGHFFYWIVWKSGA